MLTKQYYVYIMTNKYNTVLYTGVTGNLIKRIYEHKTGKGGKFSSKYKVNKLVYYEICQEINGAIAREKGIKGGSRAGKEKLINSMNPNWIDLYNTL